MTNSGMDKTVLNSGIRLLVFDWDGTIEDSAGPIIRSIEDTLRAAGREPPSQEKIKSVIGLNFRSGLARLFPEEDLDQLASDCLKVASLTSGRGTNLFPGVSATLSTLTTMGYWLTVATGKSRGGLDAALSDSGLATMFLSTRTADDARSKPDPQMLNSLLDEFGVLPEEALMIGDTTFDLEMARNAGVGSIAVTCGTHTRDQLDNTGIAAHVVPTINDLLVILKELRDV